jgi:predicted nucleic acid-binding protein
MRLSWQDIRSALQAIQTLCPSPIPVTIQSQNRAVRIAEGYGYSVFDSLVIAAALEGKCETLFSEDMRDGQRIEGLTIRNPFRQGT